MSAIYWRIKISLLAYLALKWHQASLTSVQYVLEHIELFFLVERSDFEEALVDDRAVEFQSADDTSDVVAEVAQRQCVGGVGREYDVHVSRPRLRQPRQALRSASGRSQVVEPVQQNHQLLVSS